MVRTQKLRIKTSYINVRNIGPQQGCIQIITWGKETREKTRPMSSLIRPQLTPHKPAFRLPVSQSTAKIGSHALVTHTAKDTHGQSGVCRIQAPQEIKGFLEQIAQHHQRGSKWEVFLRRNMFNLISDFPQKFYPQITLRRTPIGIS